MDFFRSLLLLLLRLSPCGDFKTSNSLLRDGLPVLPLCNCYEWLRVWTSHKCLLFVFIKHWRLHFFCRNKKSHMTLTCHFLTINYYCCKLLWSSFLKSHIKGVTSWKQQMRRWHEPLSRLGLVTYLEVNERIFSTCTSLFFRTLDYYSCFKSYPVPYKKRYSISWLLSLQTEEHSRIYWEDGAASKNTKYRAWRSKICYDDLLLWIASLFACLWLKLACWLLIVALSAFSRLSKKIITYTLYRCLELTLGILEYAFVLLLTLGTFSLHTNLTGCKQKIGTFADTEQQIAAYLSSEVWIMCLITRTIVFGQP